jgi:hypothetical protein
LIVEEAYAWAAEEVLLSWLFFQYLGESAMGEGNIILSASKQAEQEARVGEAVVRAKKAHCQVEQSQAERGQDENAEDFF